ncbi:MAG TPA: tetratricopeptide repeat protein [Pyrinomonadaceae bacterium]|nr:tetratricopeptide repeat protein [Pyrinomonadaceae bacterium]
MAEQVAHLNATRPLTRVAMLLVVALTLPASWFAVRWYIGNTLAEYHNPDVHGLDMGRRAVAWAPDDPLAHWRLAEIAQRRLPPDQIAQVVSEFEKAASLSPNDYRYWVPLGMAREQAGELDRAEKALRRATELAPSYAFPHWNLGNLLLRNGRYTEAFAELRTASEADPALRPQLLNLAWQVYNEDLDTVVSAVGTTANVRAELAAYVAGRHRFDEALKLWRGLGESEKRANKTSGQAITNQLIGTARFHQAIQVANDLVPGPIYHASIGQFIDGGFENNLDPQQTSVFGWQVKSQPQLQVGIDPNRGHASHRSLRLIFQVRSRLDAINVAQLVPVKPGGQYEFECYIKTENLQSGATPELEIVDGPTGSVIARSAPVATGSNDWQKVSVNFNVGDKTEAVVVRIIRGSCGEDATCPIFGMVWYDDFNFKPRS